MCSTHGSHQEVQVCKVIRVHHCSSWAGGQVWQIQPGLQDRSEADA